MRPKDKRFGQIIPIVKVRSMQTRIGGQIGRIKNKSMGSLLQGIYRGLSDIKRCVSWGWGRGGGTIYNS